MVYPRQAFPKLEANVIAPDHALGAERDYLSRETLPNLKHSPGFASPGSFVYLTKPMFVLILLYTTKYFKSSSLAVLGFLEVDGGNSD